ncbi:hypothetical protein HGRIS_002147 [Hohenbuehelia grisea]|uniref:Protein kinase domain-containing protein n=1 Tax=Hohenbuehelia grisea TaxID=104357 RepID=A0ABR3JKH4_9AGAR
MFSPDPLSPSSSSCFSPMDSDSVQTPFIGPQDLDFCTNTLAEGPTQQVPADFAGGHRSKGVSKESSKSSNFDSAAGYDRLPGGLSYSPESSYTPIADEPNPFEISFSDYSSDSIGTFSSPEQTRSPLPPFGGGVDESTEGTSDDPLDDVYFNYEACLHSPRFPPGHLLNPQFVRNFRLEDELGAGGYGFVMTARHRVGNHEVAVKFIIKSKVPHYAWMTDEALGKLPTEVILLSFIDHKNIVRCLDLYEDELYFYMVQELHGTPWSRPEDPPAAINNANSPPNDHIVPSLSISSSRSSVSVKDSGPRTPSAKHDDLLPSLKQDVRPSLMPCRLVKSEMNALPLPRPEFYRRPSHDLFECIEQSDNKRLTEKQARFVFAQVVDAVHYLDEQGVTHRDLKDENILIDNDFRVKIIDFGSAIIVDPTKPRPYYDLFYGTAAYASSEILLKRPYQAPPAEVWTLGVLLSYLLTGMSPFPKVEHAIEGRILLGSIAKRLPLDAMDLMRRCLDPDPSRRATIGEVKAHKWLRNLQTP